MSDATPATELRDRIAALFRQLPGHERLGDQTPGEIADAVLAVRPAPANEAHRVALSDALGLGTGAPWDAIHDQASELRHELERRTLMLQASRDVVAQLRADRSAVLREAANALVAGPVDSLVSAPAAWVEAIETLRRMADEETTR